MWCGSGCADDLVFGNETMVYKKLLFKLIWFLCVDACMFVEPLPACACRALLVDWFMMLVS